MEEFWRLWNDMPNETTMQGWKSSMTYQDHWEFDLYIVIYILTVFIDYLLSYVQFNLISPVFLEKHKKNKVTSVYLAFMQQEHIYLQTYLVKSLLLACITSSFIFSLLRLRIAF